MSIAKIIDHAIAVPPLDLYDINDQPKYEFFADVGYLMYTPYAYLAVYLFDKFKPKGLQITLYIFLMAVAGVLFERLAVYFHVFTYKGWTTLYSFPVYLGVATLHLIFSTFLVNYFKDLTTNRQDS
ncbi:hypothetical protein PP175_03625 [Aneurinibacillus sp. Ricciae_BoGa-3]|uniref:hypothetical protein n=1 Tax=Aneurinibacillus sp. Ricciae_BoGa-3 TaxID=3022697 RepID=UPI002341C00C|nr:hypothetical protein [Aneurinibacillus sp. Ricciae_BoGa-3]WCK55090.1 hypothetical protein PP175_03625 [Aneurinibacillus sp. Ricciae_BoGa-3]